MRGNVFTADKVPLEKMPCFAIKTAREPFLQILHEAGNLQAAGRRSKLLLTFLANTDLFNSSRIVAMFSQRPLISMCTFTDGGLLVISGLGGRLHSCPAQVQTHTEDVMTGSESLCGYSVEFKCQSPCPAPSPLPLSRSLFHLSSRPLSSLPSPPVFVRVGD